MLVRIVCFAAAVASVEENNITSTSNENIDHITPSGNIENGFLARNEPVPSTITIESTPESTTITPESTPETPESTTKESAWDRVKVWWNKHTKLARAEAGKWGDEAKKVVTKLGVEAKKAAKDTFDDVKQQVKTMGSKAVEDLTDQGKKVLKSATEQGKQIATNLAQQGIEAVQGLGKKVTDKVTEVTEQAGLPTPAAP